MLSVWVGMTFSFLAIFFLFKKKLLALLMLELSFLIVIFIYYLHSYNELGGSSFFSMMLFLGFMVLDSVLGLSCLVVSSRNSTSFLDPFFAK